MHFLLLLQFRICQLKQLFNSKLCKSLRMYPTSIPKLIIIKTRINRLNTSRNSIKFHNNLNSFNKIRTKLLGKVKRKISSIINKVLINQIIKLCREIGICRIINNISSQMFKVFSINHPNFKLNQLKIKCSIKVEIIQLLVNHKFNIKTVHKLSNYCRVCKKNLLL